MIVTEVRLNKVKDANSKIKAFANVTFDGCLVVTGISVVEGSKGLFVSMPQTIGKGEKYYDTVYPLSKEFRDNISNKVIEEYNK